MSTTPNFGIVMPEGTDTFAPLTFDNNAYTLIDSVMKANQDRGITTASCVVSGGIVTLTRAITSCAFFVFTATADFNPLETVAVDGVTVTVKYADGTTPEAGAWVINQSVLCYLNGTILNVISTRAKGVSQSTIGALGDLETTDKSNIVAAINENTEALADLEYHVGDTARWPRYTAAAALLVTSEKNLYVTLPLSKPLGSDVTSASVGAIACRAHNNGTSLQISTSDVTDIHLGQNSITLVFDVTGTTFENIATAHAVSFYLQYGSIVVTFS